MVARVRESRCERDPVGHRGLALDQPQSLDVALAGYTSGIAPPEVRAAVRLNYLDAGLTQDQAAKLLRVSRPQLANFLQGRFGMGAESVARLKEFLAQPPPITQPRLI